MISAPGIRSIAVNGITSAGLNGIETLARAIYFIAITRLVGPEGYGLWTYAIALYGLVLSAVTLGLETTVPNAYGNDAARGDRFASLALGMRLVGCCLAMALLVVYALAMVSKADEWLAIVLVTPALFMRGTTLLVRTIFTGRQQVPRTTTAILAGRIAELVAGLAIIVAGGGIELLLALHGLCWGVELAISLSRLWRESAVRPRLPDVGTALPIVRSGILISLIDLSFGFLISAPVVLYQPFARDYSEIGQIGVALQAASFLLGAVLAFLGTASPVLARSLENGDHRLARYGWLVALGCATLTAAAMLVFYLLSEPLFQLVLGHRYELARQLTYTTLLTAGIIMLPHGFQQMLVLEGWFRGLIAANGAGCLILMAMFFHSGAAPDPQSAVIAALAGWTTRAFVIMMLGWHQARQLLARFKQE